MTIPLPFALDHVNCYIIKGEQDWDIIDTGLNYPPTHQAWQKVTEEHNIRWEDIRAIYVTHYHPDHYGAAGWLQEKTGAPVYMSQREVNRVQNVWKDGLEYLNAFNISCRQHGVSEKLLQDISKIMIKSAETVFPEHPRVDILNEGDKVQLGDYLYEVIITPGHSDGHVCFYSPQNGILISGDHLLPKITSNVGLWPGSNSNPLKDFYASLDKVSKLGAKLVIPAHGEYFSGVENRVHELYIHHRERLDQMAGLAAEGKTAYEISEKVFGTELTLHEIRFAISETIAHMVYLENEREVESFTVGDIIRYKLR